MGYAVWLLNNPTPDFRGEVAEEGWVDIDVKMLAKDVAN